MADHSIQLCTSIHELKGIDFESIALMFPAILVIVSLSLVYIITCSVLFYLYSRKKGNRNAIAEEEFLEILHSPFVPRVSIIVPFTGKINKAKEKVFSLMSLQYGNTELVMVVKKGSEILKGLRKEFLLSLEDTAVPAFGLDVPVSIYRSERPGFRKFLLVEVPANTTGALLNAGLSVSTGQYLAVFTEEGLLVRDSLIRLLKPFLSSAENTIACTGSMGYRYKRVRKFTGLFSEKDIYGFPVLFPSVRCFRAAADGFAMFEKRILVLAGGFRLDSAHCLKLGIIDCFVASKYKGKLSFVNEIIWERDPFIKEKPVRSPFSELNWTKSSFNLLPFYLAESWPYIFVSVFLLTSLMLLIPGFVTLFQFILITIAAYSCLVCISLVLALNEFTRRNAEFTLSSIIKTFRLSLVMPFRRL